MPNAKKNEIPTKEISGVVDKLTEAEMTMRDGKEKANEFPAKAKIFRGLRNRILQHKGETKRARTPN